jgi:hypothetical protein
MAGIVHFLLQRMTKRQNFLFRAGKLSLAKQRSLDYQHTSKLGLSPTFQRPSLLNGSVRKSTKRTNNGQLTVD